MNNAQEKIASIKARKGGLPLTMLTAYDYPTARVLDESGVDFVLVGDSVGMVMLGFPDTTLVTLEHMLHHTAAVARAVKKALLVADLPINTYDTPGQALSTARRLVEAGAEAVKLEGGVDQEAKIAAIVDAGIPVVAHLGLLPQRVREEGGYKIKGKTATEAEALMLDVQAVNRAGACSIVLEGIIPGLARDMTRASAVPTLGIGSGKGTCDGDVAVISDLIGAFPWFVPGFAKPRADVAGVISHVAHEWIADIQTTGR